MITNFFYYSLFCFGDVIPYFIPFLVHLVEYMFFSFCSPLNKTLQENEKSKCDSD